MKALDSTWKGKVLKEMSSIPKINENNNAMVIDESEIWKRFKKGDREAFIYIYKQYFNVLYRYAFQFSTDEDFIKDQIQDLFIYIKINQKRLVDVDSIKYYLFSCLRRRIIKAKKRQDVTLSKELSHSSFAISIEDSPEESLINSQEVKLNNSRLEIALNSLNSKQREAIMYFYYENFTYQEIRDLMDLTSVKAARKLVYRALDNLNKKFPL